MDQFSHDLTVALEETSLLDRARVGRWGNRRRTRSTGNLPCAPQPTEDSSSSPTDTVHPVHASKNIDSLDVGVVALPSDSEDEKEDPLRLPCKSIYSSMRLGTLESDSLNETTFSPARFFKPNARRKRKLKRMSVEYDVATTPNDLVDMTALAGATAPTGTIRKRVLKPDPSNRSTVFFCGKRKRSNRDRYHDQEVKSHSSSMPRHNQLEEYRMRPRSFSSTSKPYSDRLLPLNKGLLSKIERISQQQKTETAAIETANNDAASTLGLEHTVEPIPLDALVTQLEQSQPELEPEESHFHHHRKKGQRSQRRTQLQQLQFAVDKHPMDCGELNDFLSSSSLSSSETDNEHTANDTDREGDDELTDWPGNEGGGGPIDGKLDSKRKLTKRINLSQIKSEEEVCTMMAEDDTLMSDSGGWAGGLDLHESLEVRYQPSEPIAIASRSCAFLRSASNANDDTNIPFKQIESEMSGETSNPFLPSPPCQPDAVREIRAGCRRVKSERPGFSIKTSVNERLARFLQDPRQAQIRLPDIEIYEHESLINLATLYSLQMSLDNGCAILTKTSNTTQSVNIDQQGLQNRLFLSDYKRRCYDRKSSSIVPRK